MITGETKSVWSLNSPIRISICKIGQFDVNNELGVSNENHYYKGQLTNGTFISWMGLGGNLTANETINVLFPFDGEYMRLSNGEKSVGKVSNTTVLPNGRCKQFEGLPSGLLVLKGNFKNDIQLFLKDILVGSEYFVFVSDPAASPHFQLPKPLLSGVKVKAKAANYSKVYYYSLVLTEKKMELNDGSCVDYPDAAGHESYADCVEEENQRKILPVLGCMPPWLSDTLPCNQPILKSTDELKRIQKWIFSIFSKSKTSFYYEAESCTLPCTQIAVHTTLQDIKHVGQAKTFSLKFNMFVDEIVKVERIGLAYGTVDLLVEVGSCLGLWLGLSVVGIFDILVVVLVKIRNIKIK